MHHIYIKTNPDWEHKVKYGYVWGDNINLINRLHDSSEEHSELSTFTHIYKFTKTDNYKLPYKEIDKIFSIIASSVQNIEIVESMYNTTLSLLRDIGQYLVKSNTKQTNEFIYKTGLDTLSRLIKEEFNKLGLTLENEFTEDEILDINSSVNKRISDEFTTETDTLLSFIKPCDIVITESVDTTFIKRGYQSDIIKHGIDELNKTHKFYLELATGGGKSYIIYKLMDVINPDTIIIFSPRKKINIQNGNKKYLSILSEKYYTFNYSEDTNFEDWLFKHRSDKKIIIACTQSQEKIYDAIVDKELQDICIWFDEAHWSIESWIDSTDCGSKQFFMNDKDFIKKRIFTSASPDKDKIYSHPDVFGDLYCPIKVKELIDLKWLCSIKPRILEYDTESLNLGNWIIEEFSINKSKYGFSFHSRDNNAFNLFYQHYQSYKDKNTTITPYLLIDNGGLSDENKKKLENIHLYYDFRNDKHFEDNEKSIGYVCKRYDMGYDFDKLDYLVFSDPKMSRQDIIQCIGRGTRPDGFGENGTNLNKVLNVMLPVYIGDNEGAYKNIIEVLRYLVLDLDVDILEEFIHNDVSVSPRDKKGKGVDYSGHDNRSVLLDLIYQRNILERPTTKILYRFCHKYEIKTEEAYNHFKRLNPSIPLKANIYEYNGFKWQNVMDPDGEIYYIKEGEIEKAEDQIVRKIEDEEELEEFYAEREETGWIVLNRYDPKIPPMKIGQLEHYY